jgi:hypothetical protein
MRSILLTPALSYGERSFDVVDLVLAGLLDGGWQALERGSAAGVGAEQELDARGDGPTHESVREAGRAFRYARNLIAREDLEAWLATRSLTSDDWRGYLRRLLARERATLARPADATPVLRVDAICSGALQQCAARVVAGAAAGRALAARGVEVGILDGGEDGGAELVAQARATAASGLDALDDGELERRAGAAWALELDRRRLGDEVAAAAAVERCIAGHGLDWLAFETVELEVGSEDAAREARLCVQEDGEPLAQVAAETGSVAVTRTHVFAETTDALRSRLVAAGPGDVLGPIPAGDGFLVVQVLVKRPPSAHDPAVVERARAELLAEEIGRHSAGRVTWHVAL